MSIFNAPPNGGSHLSIFPHSSLGSFVPPREFFSPAEIASLTGISVKTLEKWRRTGEGPQFIRLSYRKVLYELKVFLAWMKSLERTSTSDPKGGV